MRIHPLLCALLFTNVPTLRAQELPLPIELGAAGYAYESKPDDEAFTIFNPAKAPQPTELLLKTGDKLAIVGDSITEQKMYSRIIENYLTACVPNLQVTVRQYGWSGERSDGFLRRMDRDCLTFEPTVVTLCYGMNDARYRPFDITNGRWYHDHYAAIVRKLKDRNIRVVVGSPGCSGKLASWVKPKSGTLEEHNLNLCALRDIALQVAQENGATFADVFWPMYQQQILAPRRFNKSAEEYAVAGKDGIHPGWAGQAIMAYAFLSAMGLDGNVGSIEVDLDSKRASSSGLHKIASFDDGVVRVVSSQYPFCSTGATDDDNSLRSGLNLVPFHQRLNRFSLKVKGATSQTLKISWGGKSKEFTAEQLKDGINLAAEFEDSPFQEAFARLDKAVLDKQSFETHQVKQVFHGAEGKADFAAAVAKTEAERQPLAQAVRDAVVPVEHQIKIEAR